jgi:hypothetical protein
MAITPLSADTIFLSEGDSLSGQLLKVSKDYLIIEMINQSGKVTTISLHRNEVTSVIDESDDILYERGILKERDLEDFYRKSFPKIQKTTLQEDTIVFKNGDEVIGKVISTTTHYVTYKRSDKPANRLYSSTYDKIRTINGKSTEFSRNIYKTAPKIKVFHYPHIFIEFGFSATHHNLNQYHSIFKNVIENIETIEYKRLREINNPIIAVNIGFGIKLIKYMSLAGLADFTLNFGNNEDYSEDSEHFRLFLAELRFFYPVNAFSIWIGAGLANQSITVINRFSKVDIKYTSSASTISIAGGLSFEFNNHVGALLTLRYLPFGDRHVTIKSSIEGSSRNKINLTNILLSTALVINL